MKRSLRHPIIVAQIMGKMNGGGVESVIMNYYREIDRNKVQFDFICDEDSTNIPRKEIEDLGGHVIICPPYQRLSRYCKFLMKLFQEKQYKIVHSNINTLSVFPLYTAKKAKIPIRIAHSHNTSNPNEIKRNCLKNILRPFSKKYATTYFACSELAGRYQFGNRAYKKGMVKIIHNAININSFKFDSKAREQLRKKFSIPEDSFVIGHIGAFRKQKNHEFLIGFFSKIHKENPDTFLVLVGQGPLENKIKKIVADQGLANYVKFLGQRSDTNKIYSVFDAFCMPSLYEGLPVVAIEAQANGLPVYLSEKITKEAIICRNCQMLKLNDSWSTICKTSARINTDLVKQDFSHKNFSIQAEAKRVCDYYTEMS